MNSDTSSVDRTRSRAAIIAVAVGLLLFFVKAGAYFITGSNAILSDALESIVNVVASSFALYAVLRSSRPPDRNYPYGYGKIELFSAGFEGAMVIIAGLGILWISIPAFWNPRPLAQLDLGLALIIVGGVVNYLLGVYLIRTGRNVRSDALVADGHHVQSDSFTTLGVVIGLVLVWVTGWEWIDPLVACIVALNLLRIGARITRESLTGLMDKSDPEFMAKLVEAMQRLRQPGWIAPHHLRSWRSGATRYVDFHLVVPRYWELEQVHQTETDIDRGLMQALGEQGQVIIHVDPCIADYCPLCQMPDCPVRVQAAKPPLAWKVDLLTAGPPHPLFAQSNV
ncbi:MAG: cation transporter [Caldilineales bacterium]|nr:cation transporter [Caldilineales bacterium]